MSPEVRSDLATLSGYHSAQVEVDVRLNTNESPFTLPAGYTELKRHEDGAVSLSGVSR